MGKLFSQNNYSTKITSPILLTTGTISFSVLVAPTYTRGFCFIGNMSNPEIGYFTRSGNTLTIAGPARTGNKGTHEIGEEIRIVHGAEFLNRIENILETTFSYEIIGDLTINVFGGPYTLNGQIYTATDTEITVEDNQTTYVYLRYLDNSLQSSRVSGILTEINDSQSAEYGRLLLTVITANEQIVSVSENRARDFIDANALSQGTNTTTPELLLSYINTLLHDDVKVGVKLAIFNPGDSVDKYSTLEELFIHAQDQGYIEKGFVGAVHEQVAPASTWTVTHNLNTTDVMIQFFDDSSPSNEIFPNTVDFYNNYVTVSWAGNSVAGKAVVGAPSGTSVAKTGTTLELTAGESLSQTDFVRKGITGRQAGMNSSYIPDPDTTTFDTINSTKYLYQTFKALKADLTKIQVFAKKSAAPDTTSIVLDVYATTTSVISGHTYNVPTGASLGTATISHTLLSTNADWVSGTLSVAIDNLTPGNYYAIKISVSGSQTVYIGYGDDGLDYLTNGFTFVSSLTPITGDFAFIAQADDLENESTTKVYQASAFEAETGIILGVIQIAVAKDDTAKVDTHVSKAFSALDPDVPKYYLSDVPGQISETPGTNTIEAGIPITSSTLLIR